MSEHMSDRLRFLRAFLANPRQVGAVLPTSRWAVRGMLDLADLSAAGLVVELGAGTGVQTGEILARLGPGARLVSLEIDPDLAKLLDARYDDPRLQVVCDSAENLDTHLDGQRADVLVSALPYTSFDAGLRRRVLDLLPRALAPDGALLVIQYSPIILGELRRRFGSVTRTITPWNVPPAFLFACREPRT
ncbi:class I SAM-dependent methyltransferase [Geodermatophilus marinus]|uniref:class I SAM-dependent methyltransferase n=1 Tax=Geodermatophilus sp. LHW52908 TaxID=2303986 RepID=UPI000E3CA00C|nr:rRNA adenine N-6-methyltransferase family protein [Geodermatophilus sp. LHW52908]RFU20802.1 methyltransferase domain-containing protein [Geodermatophilus sp. LHW52908]